MAARRSSRLACKSQVTVKATSRTPENGGLEIQCSICLGSIKYRGRLSVCKHKFCYTCILEWSKNTNTCPLCKNRFRCITRVCVAGTTPPRQVRVADRNGYQDEELDGVEDDDDVVIDDIRETIVDYLAHLAPHVQSSRATDEYDYNDSFIDDSQLSPLQLSSVQLQCSPAALRVVKHQRRAFLLDSDSDTSPILSNIRLRNDLQNVDCDDVAVVPDTPYKSVATSPLVFNSGIVKRKISATPQSKRGWLSTRKRKQHKGISRQLQFL